MKKSNYQRGAKQIPRKVSDNPAKARSLIDTAHERLAYARAQKAIAQNANFIFENMYSSLLEIIHALCIRKGFKVANHLCIGYFLRDVLKRIDLYRKFDICRYRRNGIAYYGERMDFETAQESIELTEWLLAEIEKIR